MSARLVVIDSVTHCGGRVQAGHVLVAVSFAGALSLRLALPFGIRGLIAHAAGVGKDAAGVSALAVADGLGVPVAAVETMSARIGDGPSVHRSEEHTSELQSQSNLVCRLLLEKKKR